MCCVGTGLDAMATAGGATHVGTVQLEEEAGPSGSQQTQQQSAGEAAGSSVRGRQAGAGALSPRSELRTAPAAANPAEHLVLRLVPKKKKKKKVRRRALQ